MLHQVIGVVDECPRQAARASLVKETIVEENKVMTVKPRDPLPRRNLFRNGVAALVGAALTSRAVAAVASDGAAGRGNGVPPPAPDARSILDQFAVTQVIARERLAHEAHDYDVEAACFHPDAIVDVSWYSGSAAQFVDTGRKAAARGLASTSLKATYFDSLSPPTVWVNGDRAIAEASCAVHSFAMLGDVEVHVTAYTRLLWRVVKQRDNWLILGLRGLYLRDTMQPVDSSQTIAIDQKKLAGFRPSYRYISYLTVSNGGPIRNDRAGVDRPETVVALRTAERRWLAGEPDVAPSRPG